MGCEPRTGGSGREAHRRGDGPRRGISLGVESVTVLQHHAVGTPSFVTRGLPDEEFSASTWDPQVKSPAEYLRARALDIPQALLG